MKRYQSSATLKLAKGHGLWQNAKFIAIMATIVPIFVVAASLHLNTSPAQAITPPDSCFAFDEATGNITNYYTTKPIM